MNLKYDIKINDDIIVNRLRNLINQTYKLLPTREEGLNWEKLLQTIMEEISGMYRLMNCGYQQIFLPLLSKLEGLYLLTNEEDFLCYRRIIFECLGLMNELEKRICHQNY